MIEGAGGDLELAQNIGNRHLFIAFGYHGTLGRVENGVAPLSVGLFIDGAYRLFASLPPPGRRSPCGLGSPQRPTRGPPTRLS